MPVDPNQITGTGTVVPPNAVVVVPKPFWKSKTFWANAIIAGSAYFNYLPPNVAVYVAAATNIFLRFLTDSPITLTGK